MLSNFKTLILLFLLLIPISGFCQEDEVPLHKFQINGLFKSAIGPELVGTSGLVGVQLTQYFNAHLEGQLGIGIPGVGVKLSAYPWEIDRGKLRPYVGLSGIVFYNFPGLSSVDYTSYLPIGITWFTNRRVNLSLDAGPAYLNYFNNDFTDGQIGVHLGFKLGYRITFVRFEKRQKYIDPESIPDPN